MNKRFRTVGSAVAALAILTCTPAVAAAQKADANQETDSSQEMVLLGQLDLSRAEDASSMLERLEAAADRVCWRYTDHSHDAAVAARKCAQAAVESAVKQAGKPMLTDAYATKYSPVVVAQARGRSGKH